MTVERLDEAVGAAAHPMLTEDELVSSVWGDLAAELEEDDRRRLDAWGMEYAIRDRVRRLTASTEPAPEPDGAIRRLF